MNKYIEEINGNNYLRLVLNSESKEKKNEELWSKIRSLVMLITTNSDDYDKKIHENQI